jgi:hypothetical protein
MGQFEDAGGVKSGGRVDPLPKYFCVFQFLNSQCLIRNFPVCPFFFGVEHFSSCSCHCHCSCHYPCFSPPALCLVAPRHRPSCREPTLQEPLIIVLRSMRLAVNTGKNAGGTKMVGKSRRRRGVRVFATGYSAHGIRTVLRGIRDGTALGFPWTHCGSGIPTDNHKACRCSRGASGCFW